MPYMFVILNLIFLTCVIAVFLLLLIKERKLRYKLVSEVEKHEIIIQASSGGYYLWSNLCDLEYFSQNIYQILGLDSDSNSNVKSFYDFSGFFGNEKENLIKLKDQLVKAKIDDFLVNLVIQYNDSKKIICCSGKRIENQNNTLEGIIIWFNDVTDYVDSISDLIKAEEALGATVNDYRKIFDKLPIAIWLKDQNNKIISYNRLCKEISHFNGKPKQLGDPDLEIDLSIYKNPNDKQKQTNIQKHVVVKGDRKKFAFHESLLDKDNENNGILGYATDVTEQEKIEKNLQLHISAHSDLLESSSSAIAIYGDNTRLEFYNNAFMKVWGFEENWLNSKPRYNEVLDDLRFRRKLPEQSDFSKYRNEQLALFKDLTDTKYDYQYLPNGGTFRVIIIPHALGGLLFVYEDMTDSFAMQSSYNTLVKVQKETLDSLNEAIAVFSEDGFLKLFNPNYCKLWNFDEKYLKTKPHRIELFEKCKDRYYVLSKHEDYKKEWLRLPGLDEKIQFLIERKDGRIINKSIISLPNGDYLISFHDITNNILAERGLKESNELLKKSDKLKTDFLSSVSYEFRTPLTSIIGFSETLYNESLGSLNKKQKEYLDAVIFSAYELSNLTSDIIDITSMEIDNIAFEVQEFDIVKAVDKSIKSISLRADASNIKIRINCPSDIGLMVGDESRVRQIIYNIVSNSIKFSKNGQEVRIDIYTQNDNKIVFKFTDNGIGIARSDKNRIFDKFFKTDSAQKISNTSSGIGLSVVKTLLDLHNATIEVESEENKGAIFYCIFDRKNEKLLKYLDNGSEN